MTDSTNNQNFDAKVHNNVITLVNQALEDMEKGEEVTETFQNRATAILILISLIMFVIFIAAVFWHDLL
jgi:hypothetical protein